MNLSNEARIPVDDSIGRSEIKEFVRTHPDLRQLFSDEDELDALLKSSEEEPGPAVDRAVMTFVVATRQIVGSDLPTPMEILFDRIDERIARDPDLRDEYETIRERMERFGGEKPIATQLNLGSGPSLPSDPDAPSD